MIFTFEDLDDFEFELDEGELIETMLDLHIVVERELPQLYYEDIIDLAKQHEDAIKEHIYHDVYDYYEDTIYKEKNIERYYGVNRYE